MGTLDRASKYRELTVAVAAILLASIIACGSMLWYGAPDGDNILTNITWSQHFARQLSQGDPYPRWLMGMNDGAGSPAFYYYGPLPFYFISIPTLLFPRLPAQLQLAFGEWILLALSGLTFLKYARTSYNTKAAVICSCFYMLMPYHFEIDLWRRQDVGEIANYVWLPLILEYTEALPHSPQAAPKLAVSYALLSLSHLPSALLFSICLCPCALVPLSCTNLGTTIRRFTLAIISGVLLAAIYWLPALFDLQYVHSERLWQSSLYDFHRWFFPLNSLELFPGDPSGALFAKRLTYAVGLSTLIFVGCWSMSWLGRKPSDPVALKSSLVIFTVASFLMLPASTFLWEHVSLLSKVQFPWRIAIATDLAAAISMLPLIDRARGQSFGVCIVRLLLPVSLLSWSVGSSHVNTLLDPFVTPQSFLVEKAEWISQGADVPEYQTHWNLVKYEDVQTDLLGKPRLNYTAGSGVVSVDDWDIHRIDLTAHLARPTRIKLRQFYFPSWHAYDENGAIQVTPTAGDGLIEIHLPPGHHHVTLKLQYLPMEWVGLWLSAVGVIMLLLVAVSRRAAHTRTSLEIRNPPL